MTRVLLVEPDRVLGNLYRRALMGGGHDVEVAATAQRAIFAVDECGPDLILLEMQLVGHSGMEFLYELRSYTEWQHIPVVILSSVPPAEFLGAKELLSRELNVSAYYYKPHLSLKELLENVDQMLAQTFTNAAAA